MKTKSRNTLFIALLIGIIAIAVFSSSSRLSLISGESPLSLTKAQFSSNGYGDLFNGEVWIYTFTTGGLSAQMNGYVSPSTAESVSVDGNTPKKSFTLNTVVNGQQCNYDLTPDNNADPIYEIQVIGSASAQSELSCKASSTAQATCGTSKVPLVGLWAPEFLRQYSCLYACGIPKTAQISKFNSPDYNIDFFIVSKIQGQDDESKEFNTQTGSVAGFLDNSKKDIYVQWNGNLDTGRTCPSENAGLAMYTTAWHSLDSSLYDSYKNQLDILQQPIGLNQDEFRALIALTTEKGQIALESADTVNFGKEYIYDSGSPTWYSRTDLTSGRLSIEVNGALQIPLITAYIDADNYEGLGFNVPVGLPRITSTSTSCFDSGSSGIVDVDITNIGDAGETFDGTITCTNPIFNPTNVRDFFLTPGEQGTMRFGVSATSTEKVEGECTVAVSGTENSDSATVTLCVDNANLARCIPGDVFCADGNVVQCNDDRITWENNQVCEAGCFVDPQGRPTCKNADGTLPPPTGDDGDGNFSAVLFWITMIVSIVVGVISARASEPFAKTINKKYSNWVMFGVFLVVAVALFFLIPWLVKGIINMFSLPSINLNPFK